MVVRPGRRGRTSSITIVVESQLVVVAVLLVDYSVESVNTFCWCNEGSSQSWRCQETKSGIKAGNMQQFHGTIRINRATKSQTHKSSSSQEHGTRQEQNENALEGLFSGHLPGALCSGTLKPFSCLVSPSARSPWRAPHDILCGRSSRPGESIVARDNFKGVKRRRRKKRISVIIISSQGSACL